MNEPEIDEDFVRLYQTDPYVALVARMRAEAWALGYEAARRDAEAVIDDGTGVIRPDNPHFAVVAALRWNEGSRLVRRAMRELADARNRSEQAFVLALAGLGKIAHQPHTKGHEPYA